MTHTRRPTPPSDRREGGRTVIFYRKSIYRLRNVFISFFLAGVPKASEMKIKKMLRRLAILPDNSSCFRFCALIYLFIFFFSEDFTTGNLVPDRPLHGSRFLVANFVWSVKWSFFDYSLWISYYSIFKKNSNIYTQCRFYFNLDKNSFRCNSIKNLKFSTAIWNRPVLFRYWAKWTVLLWRFFYVSVNNFSTKYYAPIIKYRTFSESILDLFDA